MSYRYLFHEAAQKDYEDALLWYLERSEKAASNFVIAVDITLQKICDYPTRWRNEYKYFYELGVKKYPYTIIYSIEANNQLVIISSIYHHKRNPKKRYRN